MAIRITLYAGIGDSDDRQPSTTVRTVDDRHVAETLHAIGLEWKTADYMPDRQVVITLDPVDDMANPNVKALVSQAADLLERTGLL